MTKIQGTEEGGSKNEPPIGGRVTRRLDPIAVLAQSVADLSAIQEGLLQQGPSAARIDLRMLRYRLYEAFPRLKPTDSDLAQALAEEDGHAVEDSP